MNESDKVELSLFFAIWIRTVLLRQSKHALVLLPKANDLNELKMSLAERFDERAKEHERKGIEKGIEKGEALLRQRQLERCFRALPNEVVNQIATA